MDLFLFSVVTACLGSLTFCAIVTVLLYWVLRVPQREADSDETQILNQECPTITYTGYDIANPTKTELTCTDMVQAFGPELAAFSNQDAANLTCDDFQTLLEMDAVKSLLQVDSIPKNYCSSNCCDIAAYKPTSLACITAQEYDPSGCDNMCVNGITEDDWRCDLGRPFTYQEDGSLLDSWTNSSYQGTLYGTIPFESAGMICCTEQLKSGLE